ncbi:AAA family ATPase [Bradyrhizobium diazoefficiens]|uniref:AAA family ATPase n=1 Tax=Bradyrhizobium diazoefficiens TaxID=1355477 RepID=UPI003475FE2A
MKITSIKLKNFKRFSDLVIREIPETAKVVVVVGPNGCGKSSLFDALLTWYRAKVGFGFNGDLAYYRKHRDETFEVYQSIQVTLAGNAEPVRGSLYIRTAYRNDPDFAISGISYLGAAHEENRVERAIQNDATVSANYQRLVYDTMSAVYDPTNDAKSVLALREELIGAVRRSMQAVFGDLILNNISDPLGSGTFYFDKGAATGYNYKNLSGGEKAAFDLLLDVHVKRKFYQDAVYCIDEMETHLHTKVQGQLLKELANIIPTNSQLWVTTHSLGVLRAAQEMSANTPGSVCVIDFDPVNPDEAREILPSNLDRISWEKMLSIALDDLSHRLSPEVLVICEGSSIGNRRKDFDAEIYNRILGSRNPGIIFISGGSSNQITASGVSIRDTMSKILPETRAVALCDRDEKSDFEVSQFEAAGNFVLPRRNLESYLFADDVIQALLTQEGKEHLLTEARAIIQKALTDSVERGNPGDDFKSAAGDIYVQLKRLLGLTRVGNTTETFMRDTLAPLIRPGMVSYDELKLGIIDRLR